MSFEIDLQAGEEVEKKVLSLLEYKFDRVLLTKGYYKDFDIIATKQNKTYTFEVKYSRCPEKFIAFEVFNLITLAPTCISISTADFFILVIRNIRTEQDEVYIIKTTKLKEFIQDEFRTKNAISSTGGDNKAFVYINIPINNIKSASKFMGTI